MNTDELKDKLEKSCDSLFEDMNHVSEFYVEIFKQAFSESIKFFEVETGVKIKDIDLKAINDIKNRFIQYTGDAVLIAINKVNNSKIVPEEIQ